LDTKIKSEAEDPDGRWITTWNDYLIHIRLFLRWLHNCNCKQACKNGGESLHPQERMPDKSNWETPPAARIKNKRTRRQNPYAHEAEPIPLIPMGASKSWAIADKSVPSANSLIIAAKIPGAWVVQIKDAGHALMSQYPDKFYYKLSDKISFHVYMHLFCLCLFYT
jgi:hypothetical protein